MDQQAHWRASSRVCGSISTDPLCVCIRPPGHWGPHVTISQWNTFRLVQTSCCPISFEIAEAVARKAMHDPNWTWAE